MGNCTDSSKDYDSEPAQTSFDVKERSSFHLPSLRSERFCHTDLMRYSLMFPSKYHDFNRWNRQRRSTLNFHVTATDPRAKTSGQSMNLYGNRVWWRFHRYPSPINNEDFLPTVDKAISEISSIGEQLKHLDDAQKMCAGLCEMKEYGEQKILEYCIQLYTQSSFLFRVLHKDLGDYYSLDTRNLDNYEQLLHLYVERYGKAYTGIVYRGAMLNDEKLKLYVTSDYYTTWYSETYLSTSKCRQVAELFGNTLIIIEIDNMSDGRGKAVDISELSAIPEEEEVLLTPSYMLFKIKQPEFDSNLNKHIIYLTSTLSSIYSTIVEDDQNYCRTRKNRNEKSSHRMDTTSFGRLRDSDSD